MRGRRTENLCSTITTVEQANTSSYTDFPMKTSSSHGLHPRNLQRDSQGSHDALNNGPKPNPARSIGGLKLFRFVKVVSYNG